MAASQIKTKNFPAGSTDQLKYNLDCFIKTWGHFETIWFPNNDSQDNKWLVLTVWSWMFLVSWAIVIPSAVVCFIFLSLQSIKQQDGCYHKNLFVFLLIFSSCSVATHFFKSFSFLIFCNSKLQNINKSSSEVSF